MTLRLRDVNTGDLELLMAWRSNPEIYRYFRQERPPTWGEHLEFWNRALFGKERKDYMILFGEKWNQLRRIGTCNLSNLESDSPEYGLLIGEVGLHGKGIGDSVTMLCMEEAKKLGKSYISARVHHGNVASRRMFEKCEFVTSGSQNAHGEVEYVRGIAGFLNMYQGFGLVP